MSGSLTLTKDEIQWRAQFLLQDAVTRNHLIGTATPTLPSGLDWLFSILRDGLSTRAHDQSRRNALDRLVDVVGQSPSLSW